MPEPPVRDGYIQIQESVPKQVRPALKGFFSNSKSTMTIAVGLDNRHEPTGLFSHRFQIPNIIPDGIKINARSDKGIFHESFLSGHF